MNQVQEGLFMVEEQMPCSPKAIIIHYYSLPSTLDRAEQEEAAARILLFSQQLNRWVGVSWHHLAETMQNECERVQNNDIPNNEIPFSGIFVFGLQYIIRGINELVEKSLLYRVTVGEGDNALDVFFPTSALVSRIMQKQDVLAN